MKTDFKEGNLIKELYKGYMPLFVRQAVAWTIFLTADAQMKHMIRGHLNINETDRIPQSYLMYGSFCVSILNTFCIMPFDSVKTQMQQAGKNVKHTWVQSF